MKNSILGLALLLVSILGLGLTGCGGTVMSDDFGDGVDFGSDKGNARTGWSASGTLVSNNSNKTVQLQAVFPVPGTYTVQFLMVPAPNSSPRARALITWSVAGNQISRIVDVYNGVSVSGVGEGVQVRVYDDAYQPGNEEYSVSITVGKGVRPATQSPPTLTPLAFPLNIIAGGTDSVPVDPNAGVQSVMVGVAAGLTVPPAAGKVKVKFLDNAAAYLASYYVDNLEWIPIPPGTLLILIQNDSAVTIDATVTFGIDG